MSGAARGARSRAPLPDALRALALIGVVVVNLVGYVTAPWGPLLGVPVPADSLLAMGVYAGIATLLQGKAYPLLTFLFGYSLVLAAPRGGSLEPSRRRLGRLLALGLVHGLLVYFGDVLTLYALTAMLVLRRLREPWRTLRPRLRRAAVGAVAVTLLSTALSWFGGDPVARPALGAVTDWPAFLVLNASAFAASTPISLLLFLPLLRALMLLGIAAARLRWLTHPRSRRAAKRLASRWLLPALATNIAYGVALLSTAGSGSTGYAVLVSLGPLIGIPLTVAAVAYAVERWHAGRRGWVRLVAPLGRVTLTLYLVGSIVCVAVLSGVGLRAGDALGTVGTLGLALALWGVAGLLAHAAVARGWRGPFEAWLARPSR